MHGLTCAHTEPLTCLAGAKNAATAHRVSIWGNTSGTQLTPAVNHPSRSLNPDHPRADLGEDSANDSALPSLFFIAHMVVCTYTCIYIHTGCWERKWKYMCAPSVVGILYPPGHEKLCRLEKMKFAKKFSNRKQDVMQQYKYQICWTQCNAPKRANWSMHSFKQITNIW